MLRERLHRRGKHIICSRQIPVGGGHAPRLLLLLVGGGSRIRQEGCSCCQLLLPLAGAGRVHAKLQSLVQAAHKAGLAARSSSSL